MVERNKVAPPAVSAPAVSAPAVSAPAVQARALSKSYGPKRAVDGIDLEVRRGEIFGILGHNGAGKTTSIECILGTRKPDSGSVEILGMDPAKERRKVFARVGVQFQASGFQDKLRVGEAFAATACLYRNAGDWRESLRRFGLEGKEKQPVSTLSGGEKQKLAVALALIHSPELVFLDELTTGMDPVARRSVWDLLRKAREGGTTIVLSSHAMDEVEELCDRVAVMSKGKIVAEGSPRGLMAERGVARFEDAYLAIAGKETCE